MNRHLQITLFVFSVGSLLFSQDLQADKIEILGNTLTPIKIKPKKETGLTELYVLENTDNVRISVESVAPDDVVVSNFSMLGAAFSTPVESIKKTGDHIIISDITGDSGYIIQDGSSTSYIWIVDYSKHVFNIESLSLSPDSGCEETILDFNGYAEPINLSLIHN